jgi:NADPH-dependent 2,4-dienoyl-CoA reductase/sulfur reductase-like enzyme
MGHTVEYLAGTTRPVALLDSGPEDSRGRNVRVRGRRRRRPAASARPPPPVPLPPQRDLRPGRGFPRYGSESQRKKVAVAGAGWAGLAAAHHLVKQVHLALRALA